MAMMTPVVKTATRSFAEHWCIGLEQEHWSGTPVFGHAGGNQSGTSYLKILPERGGILAMTVNTPGALRVFSETIFDGVGAAVFRATRSRLARPTGKVPLNPERYVGTYVMTGATYQVAFDGTALSFTVTREGDTRGGPSTTRYRLVPLDEDIFLLESDTGAAGPQGDVGFFGDDGQGQATNLTAPVFPAKRIP
jgi:hypothetical protein